MGPWSRAGAALTNMRSSCAECQWCDAFVRREPGRPLGHRGAALLQRRLLEKAAAGHWESPFRRRERRTRCRCGTPHQSRCVTNWPLHDIVITNIVWYILQLRGGRGGVSILRKSLCDKRGSGVPKQRWCWQRISLTRAHMPRSKTISCKGQHCASPFRRRERRTRRRRRTPPQSRCLKVLCAPN